MGVVGLCVWPVVQGKDAVTMRGYGDYRLNWGDIINWDRTWQGKGLAVIDMDDNGG